MADTIKYINIYSSRYCYIGEKIKSRNSLCTVPAIYNIITLTIAVALCSVRSFDNPIVKSRPDVVVIIIK